MLCAAFIGAFPFANATATALSIQTNWFPRVSPTSNTLWGVTYGNGLYVAVGEKGTILASAGGGEWNTVTTPYRGDLYTVRYANGLYVAGTTNGILVSADAQQWTYRPIPVPAFGARPSRIADIAFGQGHYVAMATSDGAAATALLSSAEGFNWTQRYSAGGPSFQKCGVSFGGNRFVAVQNPWSLPGEHRFLTSTNAQDWTPSGPSFSTLDNNRLAQAVAYGNGLFFAAGYTGTGPFAGYLFRSTSGSDWSVLGDYVFQGNFSGVAYGGGSAVAVGSFAFRVSTNNGVAWSGNDTTGPTIDWYPTVGITYGSGTFVAVGYRGTIIQSAVVEETPPFFITTPTNQVIQRGATATLRSRAGGSEPLSYQWYKGVLPLVGETNATLVISNTQPADAGSYSVVVTSPYGIITSSPVSLTISFVKIASYAGLTIEGIPGRTYRMEYLNAMEPSTAWHTLTNLVLPISPYIWIDYETPSVPQRFYRASELP